VSLEFFFDNFLPAVWARVQFSLSRRSCVGHYELTTFIC